LPTLNPSAIIVAVAKNKAKINIKRFIELWGFNKCYLRIISVSSGKASSPISVWLGTVTEFKLEQFSNACLPILVTLLGMVRGGC
jgi:hypothetical protein